MKHLALIMITLMFSLNASFAALPEGCSNDKKLHDGDGDQANFFGPEFFGIFSRPPANVFVPVLMQTVNSFTLENRFKPEASLLACTTKVNRCVGSFASQPGVHLYCVKSNGKRQLEKVYKVK
jgi:hypothetical protein